MSDFALTTTDNKHDYFNEYDEWRKFDEDEMHYNTNGLLARFVEEKFGGISDAMSEVEESNVIESAIDYIVESKWLNPVGLYKKTIKQS